jgi:small subunit ribosomal protein S17
MSQTRGKKKVLQGVVISDAMDKTIRVENVRKFLHPMYKKFVTKKKRYLAHDPENECRVGDRVTIVESRPLSRRKRWRLGKVLVKAE